jgi:hypothetical protein
MFARLAPVFLGIGLVAIIATVFGGGRAVGGSHPPAPPTFSQTFKHVVVIVQENRTPDNLFHGFPNADIADSGITSTGQVVTLTSRPLDDSYDLDHSIPRL